MTASGAPESKGHPARLEPEVWFMILISSFNNFATIQDQKVHLGRMERLHKILAHPDRLAKFEELWKLFNFCFPFF